MKFFKQKVISDTQEYIKIALHNKTHEALGIRRNKGKNQFDGISRQRQK